RRGEQWDHAHAAMRSQLAGEAHIGWRPDAAEHATLLRRRLRQRLGTPADPDAAGRAPAFSAADRGMRDPEHLARLQDAETSRDVDRPSVWVGDAENAEAAARPVAHDPRKRDAGERSEECGADPGSDVHSSLR